MSEKMQDVMEKELEEAIATLNRANEMLMGLFNTKEAEWAPLYRERVCSISSSSSVEWVERGYHT